VSAEEPTPPGPPSLKGRGEKRLAALDDERADSSDAERSEASGSDPPLPFREGGAGGVGEPARRFLPHLLILLVFLGLWTWKLVEPNPVPEQLARRLSGDERFAAAKALHAGGYAFLTVLAVALPVPNYWRWFLAGLLALHGVATEVAQTFVPNRFGSVRDVLIDWAGVLLGVVAWRVARRRGAAPVPQDSRGA